MAEARARPLIGVTGGESRFPVAWWFTRLAVARAGGRALRLTPNRPEPPAALHGIVIGGGDDIDPQLYSGLDDGRAPRDPRRDAFEKAVIERALEARVPVLGICRGAQLLNVVLGGNLHQDLRRVRRRTSNRRTVLPRKTAQLEPGSQLASLLGAERLRINSLHDQAVDRPGRGLQVVARDLDGIAQAIEPVADGPFPLGVQWHPEYLPYKAEQQRLFERLVEAARAWLAAGSGTELPRLQVGGEAP